MEPTNNGGPAFPVHDPFHMQPADITEAARLAGGMTLRDYFAAKAMQSMLMIETHSVGDVRKNETAGEWIARKSFAMADAMLKARAK